MPVTSSDIVRAAVVWTISGIGEIINVFHLRVTGTPSPATDLEFISSLEEYMTNLYATSGVTGLMHNAVIHQRVELYNVSDDAPMTDAGRFTDLTGLSTGELLPTGVAALVIGRTAVKRRVGRKFLPPFSEISNASGSWGAGTIAVLNDFGDAWTQNYLTTNGLSIQAVVGGTPPLSYSDVQSYQARDVPAYQRRRKAGVGS